jgi:hypothetical protein
MEKGNVMSEWQLINTHPRDGYFDVRYEDGTVEADVYWSDTRYCMLGAPQGSRGPGLVSTEAGNLPIDIEDGITHWRPTPSTEKERAAS